MSSLFSDIGNFVGNAVSSATNEVFDEFGTALGIGSIGRTPFTDGDVPWGRNELFNDTFFPITSIDPNRWNKIYPYRLLVVDVSSGVPRIFGSTQGESNGFLVNSASFAPKVEGENTLSYVLTQDVLSSNWIANLPITPQQLNITDNFAINTSATMRGIIEEHNGIKFKTIVASGTTGIWPRKPTREGSIKPPTITNSIFGGTLEALGGVADSVTRIARAFSGNHPNKAKKSVAPENSEAGQFSTGYYQALYISQFIERYALLKKNPAHKGLRLVFDIPKQNRSYVVTPITYSIQQSEQRPNEIRFNFQFKAWKSIDLNAEVQPLGTELDTLTSNFFQRAVTVITETRRILSRSVNLVKAVRSDFQRPFNILRQARYAIKDVIGLETAVSDLPRQISLDYKDAISDSVGGVGRTGTTFAALSSGSNAGANSQTQSTVKSVASGDLPGEIISAIQQRNTRNEGLSSSLVSGGALGRDVAQNAQVDSINNIFQNPEENFEFFDAINTGDLTLTPSQEDLIEEELDRIRLLTVDDFRDFRADLLKLYLDISDNFGAGNQTYSNIYGLPDPKSRAIPMTVEENEILAALFESIQILDILAATKRYDDLDVQSPLEYVGGLADEAGIDFDSESPSKFLVPVPFGLSIEEIAARYLGDADKWVEIATINKLRSPYIDETGFSLSLLSNAEGRQLNVDDSEGRLFIGQRIILKSDTVPQFVRKIISVEKIGDNNYLVTVDGLANLDNLTTGGNATLQGFLPGTVNSQNQIYIPSSRPSQEDDRTFEISHLDEPNLTKVSKVDFLLTDDFDIALNSLGDFRLANGLNNLVQALKLKIRTNKNTLLRHLDYGLGLTHGISVADIETGNLAESLNQMIQSDPRFSSISRLTFRLTGSTLAIDMSVNVANSSGIVPITFNVKVT